MGVVRHGSGPKATLAAFGSQIHPVFMFPALAASWAGGLIAGGSSLAPAAVHTIAIFAALYTAHLKDGYVDFYLRDEDDDHPLTAAGCRSGLLLASGLFAAALGGLYVLVDWWAVGLTAPCWVIGYFHSPQLDMTTVGVTLGYPVGVGLAFLGGAYVQTAQVDPQALGVGLVLVILLAGVKIIDDLQDAAYDRSIGKPTVVVAAGESRARTIGVATFGLSIGLLVAFVWIRLFPPAVLMAAVGFGGIAWFSRGKPPEVATAMLIRSGYVFLALLIFAFWYRPLA